MKNDEPGRRPARNDPPDGEDGFRWPSADDSPRKVGRTAVHGLLVAIFARMMFVHGLAWLFVGAGLLTGAWALVQGELERRESLAAFTGRAPGVIEAPWWRLDFAPELLGDGTNWLAVTRPSACARLRFHPEGAGETTTVYCRRFTRGVLEEYSFTWVEALGPVPVRWVDEQGMPRMEFRLASNLVRWLEERGPEVHLFYDAGEFHGPERARRSDRLLGEVWRDVDDPFLRLLQEWSKPPPEVTVAYPPEDPKRGAPLPLIENALTLKGETLPVEEWMLAIPFGFFGLLAWGAGSHLVTGRSRWGTALLVLGGLVALPWASGHTGKVLGYLWDDAEMALTFIRSEMLALPPELVLAAADEEAGADTETVAWDLESSRYARLLRWIELEPPAEPMGSDAVLRHLADQVHRQAAALPDQELAGLLRWATSVQERGAGEELGLLFVDAALELRDDAARAGEVRYQAEALLRAVHDYQPSDNPHRLAVAERARILERVPPFR